MAGSTLAYPLNGAANWENFPDIVQKIQAGYMRVNLTHFDDDDEPEIAAGSTLDVNGTVVVFSAAESITGWSGISIYNIVYIKIVVSGSSATAEFTTSAPTWSDAKQGWYDGNDRYIGGLFKDGDGNYSGKWLYRPAMGYSARTLYVPGAQIGVALDLTGIGGAIALVKLTSTLIAFIDTTTKYLYTYQWDGLAWSQVGSGLLISGINSPAMAALSSTRIAFIDTVNEELRTYDWSGSAWSMTGSGLSISGIGTPSLTALNSTDVAFIDSTLESLRTYRFNGSTWSLVGSGLSLTGIGSPTLTTLNETDIAVAGSSLDELRTYRFNGSTWAQVGTGLSMSIAQVSMVTLNATDILIRDWVNSITYRCRWDGSTWAIIGPSLFIESTSLIPMAAMSEETIACGDSTYDTLTMYSVPNEITVLEQRP